MNDIILYLDCDGVILDTIETCYRMMKKEGLDITNGELVNFYFINTDWNVLIYEAGIINNAISKIKKIMESNIFSEVKILTKLSGNVNEEKIKRILFGKLLPDTEVITLKINENKDEIVNPVNNILVEDTVKNGIRWENAGGVAVYFVRKECDYENNQINDLSDICKTKSVKKLLKTRNF